MATIAVFSVLEVFFVMAVMFFDPTVVGLTIESVYALTALWVASHPVQVAIADLLGHAFVGPYPSPVWINVLVVAMCAIQGVFVGFLVSRAALWGLRWA
jgi:hypothetical protein